MADKKELAVAALRNGTVIDHIPSNMLFKAVRLLELDKVASQLTIGNNLASKRMGAKGIIKVADIFFTDYVINRLALIAPTAVINVIRDYEVVEKHPVVLPEVITGLVKCDNPKCITNNEPMKTRFTVVDRNAGILRCHYCSHSVSTEKATIL
ncbi:MAG: aspartate carbamoyltransferase regulatory subunit [Muribaculaceae bacterium]|nr:aspartate carbamoyltransferase regulatory subunit [Muribaculaceae bacterium]